MFARFSKIDRGRNKPRPDKMSADISDRDSMPNAYTVLCMWYMIAALSLFVILQLLRICIVDNDIAMPGLLGSMFILLIAEVIGYFADYSDPRLKYVFVLLTVVAATNVGIFMTYHTVLVSVVPLLVAAQYSQKKVIIFAYILSALSIFAIVVFGYEYGLCDADMVIQTVSTASDYGRYLSAEILPFADRWYSLILFFAVPRCLIITAFVPMINAIVDNRKKIMMRDVEIQYSGEHDCMTGFYNREKYASMLNDSYTRLDKVAIIYFDLNNLKRVNDSYGHDAGDEMIKRAAASIRCALTDNMDAYRLGGDEFMAVIPNGGSDDVEKFFDNWEQKLKIINSLPSLSECSVAFGYASGHGKDFSDILKTSDKNMYENKLKSKAQRTD